MITTVRNIALAIGLLFGILYVTAVLDARLGRRNAVLEFAAAGQSPDESHWSAARVQAFMATVPPASGAPIAVLRIPAVRLEVPLYETATELHLNHGVGLIEHMARPGEGGNLGIAGHRDGFFRALEEISRGDLVEVRTHARTYRYQVANARVVASDDSALLADTIEPTLTLVTCYPFYYLGRAPQRFVVRAVYLWR